MDVRVGLWRKLSTVELMLLNCWSVVEDCCESLGLQGDPISPSWRKSALNIHCKDWCWSWNSNTLATWCKELIWLKDSFEKTLMLGRIEGGRRRGWQRMRWLDGITNLMDKFEWTPGVGDGLGSLACCSPWSCKESDTTERLNWTDTFYTHIFYMCIFSS